MTLARRVRLVGGLGICWFVLLFLPVGNGPYDVGAFADYLQTPAAIAVWYGSVVLAVALLGITFHLGTLERLALPALLGALAFNLLGMASWLIPYFGEGPTPPGGLASPFAGLLGTPAIVWALAAEWERRRGIRLSRFLKRAESRPTEF